MVIPVGIFMVTNSVLSIMWLTSPIKKKFWILSICNELTVKNCRPKVYFGKNMFMWLKILFCIWIRVLAAELALGGISNNESLEHCSLLEPEKAKLIE